MMPNDEKEIKKETSFYRLLFKEPKELSEIQLYGFLKYGDRDWWDKSMRNLTIVGKIKLFWVYFLSIFGKSVDKIEESKLQNIINDISDRFNSDIINNKSERESNEKEVRVRKNDDGEVKDVSVVSGDE